MKHVIVTYDAHGVLAATMHAMQKLRQARAAADDGLQQRLLAELECLRQVYEAYSERAGDQPFINGQKCVGLGATTADEIVRSVSPAPVSDGGGGLSTGNPPKKTGVSFDKNSGKWRARIGSHDRLRSLGYFTDFDAAAAAYDQAKRLTQGAGTRYQCVKRCICRAGFDLHSEFQGHLEVGTGITALESRWNSRGQLRVRFDQGWVSVTAGDGGMLLAAAAAAPSFPAAAIASGPAPPSQNAQPVAARPVQQVAVKVEKLQREGASPDTSSAVPAPASLPISATSLPTVSIKTEPGTNGASRNAVEEVAPELQWPQSPFAEQQASVVEQQQPRSQQLKAKRGVASLSVAGPPSVQEVVPSSRREELVVTVTFSEEGALGMELEEGMEGGTLHTSVVSVDHGTQAATHYAGGQLVLGLLVSRVADVDVVGLGVEAVHDVIIAHTGRPLTLTFLTQGVGSSNTIAAGTSIKRQCMSTGS
eukprot:COSAG01_NODE_8549_length_2745_cov_8.692366_1_plen_477_part_00